MGSLGRRHPKIYKYIYNKTLETEKRRKISLLPIHPTGLDRPPIESDVTFEVRIPAKEIIGTPEIEIPTLPHVLRIGKFEHTSF